MLCSKHIGRLELHCISQTANACCSLRTHNSALQNQDHLRHCQTINLGNTSTNLKKQTGMWPVVHRFHVQLLGGNRTTRLHVCTSMIVLMHIIESFCKAFARPHWSTTWHQLQSPAISCFHFAGRLVLLRSAWLIWTASCLSHKRRLRDCLGERIEQKQR